MHIASKYLLLMCCAVFIACATLQDVPKLGKFGQKDFLLDCDEHNYYLRVNDDYHFALFNALFVPLVEKKIDNGVFKNTKFLPPNKRFDAVFLEVLQMIKNEEKTKEISTNNMFCNVREIY